MPWRRVSTRIWVHTGDVSSIRESSRAIHILSGRFASSCWNYSFSLLTRASMASRDWNWFRFIPNSSFDIPINSKSVVIGIVFRTRVYVVKGFFSVMPFHPATFNLSWTSSRDVKRTLMTYRRYFFHFLTTSESLGPSGWGIERSTKCSRS